jgi:hypothetical protein
MTATVTDTSTLSIIPQGGRVSFTQTLNGVVTELHGGGSSPNSRGAVETQWAGWSCRPGGAAPLTRSGCHPGGSLLVASWEVAFREAHRIFRQSRDIERANTAFLAMVGPIPCLALKEASSSLTSSVWS